MRNRLLLMGMMALGAVIASTAPAGAVTDRNTSERGQPKPFVDTPHAMGHVNAMMQERYAAAGGPAERTAVAFAENIVKTLPLIPGASVITNGATLPSGNVLIGSGRGLGFTNMSLHNTVTGQIIWSAPRFLGPTDYLLRRTIGPGSYLGGISPAVSSTGQVAGWAFMTDGYNSWAFDAETGEEKWVVSQDDWPPGPQRLREEPLRDRSMSNDLPIGFPFLPEAIRAPSGEHVVGSLFTRGNFAYLDSLNGDLVILQNGDDGDLAVGIQQPILFTIIDLLCFPGGQISLSIKDWCSAFVYTRYYSANTTMMDPIRNRITVTFAGDAETFDRFMTWEVVTDNGPGQPGTILPDPDIEDGESPAFNLVWSTNFGVNSGATPTWSDSGAVIFGVDGAGITNAFDANTGEILVSSTGGGAGFSPSTDHNDLLVICSPEAGLAQVSPVDGRFLFQNPATGLGLEHLAVMPDSPLLIDGRPSEECVGFPGTHPDIYQAQFVLGYPNALFGALAGLGIPVPSTITSGAVADFQVDAQTGETIPTNFRSVYLSSGEATVTTLDSGRYLSARVDAIASIYAGIINLLLPRRFDVSPAEAGFVISEPLSFRDSVKAQFEGAAQYCDEVLNGRFGPAGDPIARPLPIVVAAPDAFNKERELQLAVNKVGYINSIMKKSVPGRINSARNDRSPPEIGDLELAFIVGNISDIVIAVTLARELLLCNVDPDNNCSDGTTEFSGLNPDRSTQNLAREAIEAACDVIDQTIDILEKETCTSNSECDDGNECTADVCNVLGVCDNTPDEGASCEGNGTCDADGTCQPPVDVCGGCAPTLNPCTDSVCNEDTEQCEELPVDDGTFCGEGLECQAGECVPTEPCNDDADCVSNDPCLTRSCNQATNSCNPPEPGNDGGSCDAGGVPGTCSGGACVGLCEGVSCPDTECSIGACDPSDGSCTDTPTNEGGDCDLGGGETGVCTGGDCVPASLCAGVDCDDGISCTDNDCDENTGECINDPLPDGTACDDFPNGYCTTAAGCVSGVKLEQNALECLGGLTGFPFSVVNAVDQAPFSGGSVVLTSEIIAVNVPTADVIEASLVDSATLVAADFELTVGNGTPAGGNPIQLSDPDIPRPVGAILEVEANAVTDVSVDGAPGEVLSVTPTQAFLQFRALGGILTVTLGVGVDDCVITGGSALFPIVGN